MTLELLQTIGLILLGGAALIFLTIAVVIYFGTDHDDPRH